MLDYANTGMQLAVKGPPCGTVNLLLQHCVQLGAAEYHRDVAEESHAISQPDPPRYEQKLLSPYTVKHQDKLSRIAGKSPCLEILEAGLDTWSNWVWFWLRVGLEGSSSSFQPQVLCDCHRQVHVLEGHNQNLKTTTVKAIPTVLILALVIYTHRKEKKKAKHVAHPKISFQNLSLHPPTIIFLVSAKL